MTKNETVYALFSAYYPNAKYEKGEYDENYYLTISDNNFSFSHIMKMNSDLKELGLTIIKVERHPLSFTFVISLFKK